MSKILLPIILLNLLFAANSFANKTSIPYKNKPYDGYLVKFKTSQSLINAKENFLRQNLSSETLPLEGWIKINARNINKLEKSLTNFIASDQIEYIQPNYVIKNPKMIFGQTNLKKIKQWLKKNKSKKIKFTDNPTIPKENNKTVKGNDTFFDKQWGMTDIGSKEAYNSIQRFNPIVVAVLDTGVDYTHEDLINNIWRNPGESGLDKNGNSKSTNGIDDDQNGYIDDSIGWDFWSNDNKPYDYSFAGIIDIVKGGNPGHGTHCAGNVAAEANNSKGISGVAPNVKIMPLRFLSEKGQGTTAGAIRSIAYAINNGANILSNSWGSEGEEPGSPENKALREIIQLSQEKGRLFIAAAGNGHSGRGYDNDIDARPSYPASYKHNIIVSVAAISVSDRLGAFSNWGKTTVDIGAPGVRTFSTVPGNRYSDTVGNLLGMKIRWDGTSMATPHVAGAAALYWSKYPNKSWREVKKALLDSSMPIKSLKGKVSSDGKLNVKSLILNH